ncbi:hypothetical protein H0H81_011341 [Sphagnurus paluster]|uniref:Uncharacterized protein n=1 Tax=Sphagnurus paluster TaxID=117069 RepID=A0A9P7G184_9AGAR|nr:hypothetical protein H0H81_011341 [Sphagnurus paluster]
MSSPVSSQRSLGHVRRNLSPELPSHTKSVERWLTDMVGRLRELSIPGAITRARLPGMVVEEYARFKKRSNSEHEYLIAKIRCPDGKPRFIRLERTVKLESQKDLGSIRHVASTIKQVSNLVLGNLPAEDTVTLVSGMPTDSEDERIESKTPQNPITLLDLAIIAHCVHEDSKNYNLLKRQCFWFGATISCLLEKNGG